MLDLSPALRCEMRLTDSDFVGKRFGWLTAIGMAQQQPR
jgi:hypothetical protein